MSSSKIFWAQIPGPRSFTREVARKLLEGDSFLLSAPSLPWPDEFRTAVRNRLYTTSSSMALDLIESKDLGGRELLEVVASHLGCPSPVRSLRDLRDFLPSGGFLLWLYRLNQQDYVKAEKLLSDAQALQLPMQLLIETRNPFSAKGTILHFDMTQMDMLYLAMTLLMESDLKDNVEYPSHLLTELSGGAPERMDEMLSHLQEALSDPVNTCPWLSPVEGKQAVYNAQIRVLLPLIENERLALIHTHEDALKQHLPFMDEYLGTYQEAAQLELRHLVYFSRHGGIRLSRQDETWLNMLYEARNELSHLDILPPEKITQLMHPPR